jgi:hypothetical protein
MKSILYCKKNNSFNLYFFFGIHEGLKPEKRKNYTEISLGIVIPNLSAKTMELIKDGQSS